MSGDTRGRLLAAAERILVEEGVHALTVRHVGKISGLNPTLITYHFGTVAALLQELCERNLAPMLAKWDQLSTPLPQVPAPGEDAIDMVLRRWLEPLLGKAAFNKQGRALDVLDEIASHGDPKLRSAVMEPMADVADRLKTALTPLLPHLSEEELAMRLLFLAGATLGPPPRMRAQGSMEMRATRNALPALMRFARAALTEAEQQAA